MRTSPLVVVVKGDRINSVPFQSSELGVAVMRPILLRLAISLLLCCVQQMPSQIYDTLASRCSLDN